MKTISTAHWSRENLAWLAGLWEGEGCFSSFTVTRPNCTVNGGRLILISTDKDIVERSKAIAGCGEIALRELSRKDPKYKDAFEHSIGRQAHVYALAVALYPFMGYRRQLSIERIINNFSTQKSR